MTDLEVFATGLKDRLSESIPEIYVEYMRITSGQMEHKVFIDIHLIPRHPRLFGGYDSDASHIRIVIYDNGKVMVYDNTYSDVLVNRLAIDLNDPEPIDKVVTFVLSRVPSLREFSND